MAKKPSVHFNAEVVDLNCSKELDQTPQPYQTTIGGCPPANNVSIEEGGIDLSASTIQRDSMTRGANLMKHPKLFEKEQQNTDQMLSELVTASRIPEKRELKPESDVKAKAKL